MGYYFNPPDDLPTVSRKLEDGTYEQLFAQLQPNEHLYGLYVRLDAPWNNAPHLFSADEMAAFQSQVYEGRLIRLGFFALSTEISKSSYPVIQPVTI